MPVLVENDCNPSPIARPCPSLGLLVFRQNHRYLILPLWALIVCICFCTPNITLTAAPTEPSQNLRPDAVALDRPWQIESYGEAASVANHRVYELAFEENGTVWIAASNGLHRYDGYRWTVYREKDGLPSTNIRTLLRSRKKELWIGTDKGAGVFNPESKSFDRRGSDKALPNQNVRRMSEDPDGTIWFCCDQWPDPSVPPGGLACYKEGIWRLFNTTSGLPMDYLISYFRTSGGRQFAGTRHGWVERISDTKWAPPKEQGHDLDDQIFAMAEQPDGTLWAQGGQQLLQLKDGKWRPIDQNTSTVTTLRDGRLAAIRRDTIKGRLCFCIWDGTEFAPASSWVDYPPNVRIYSLAEAPDGALWTVGTSTILRWSPLTHNWTIYPNISRIPEVESDGRAWIISDNRLFSLQNGQLEPMDGFSSFVTTLPDGSIVAERSSDGRWCRVKPGAPASAEPIECGISIFLRAYAENSGRIWLLGHDRDGAFVAAYYAEGRFARVEAPLLKERELSSVSPAMDGGLWVLLAPLRSLEYELYRVSILGMRNGDLGPNPPKCVTPNLTETVDHYWIQGSASVYQKSKTPGASWERVLFHETALPASGSASVPATAQEKAESIFTVPSIAVSRLITLPNEVLFIFTGGLGGRSGYAFYNDGRWRMKEENFTGIYGAKDMKTVFLGSHAGVYVRKNPGSLDIYFLPLPENVHVRTVLARDDQSFWVTTSNGIFNYKASREPPMTNVTLAVNEVPADGTIPARFSGIRRFSAQTLPRSFTYSWRFDGNAWSPYSVDHEVRLPVDGLHPGKHVLEVRCREQGGLSDPSSALAEFDVLPLPLQHRPWFIPALSVVVALLLYLTWLGIARTREISRTNAALRIEINERRKAESALRTTHDQLEQRVLQRTAELSHANDALRKEIVEREKAVEIQYQLENQLREARKLEALGTLAGGIAHDFNNILTVIIPSAHLVLDDCPQSSASRELVEQIIRSANHAKDLVQQILAFSRQQRRQLEIVDLTPIIAEAGKLLASSLPPAIHAECMISPQLPLVRADPTQIQRLLMNLCTNAKQAMQDLSGTIEIRAEAVRAGIEDAKRCPGLRRGDYVRLTVRDEGVGMDEQVRQRAFDPFFTTKSPGEGTGLGLSVVHGIVKEHGGAIRVDSAPGKGALFEIYIPASPNPVFETPAGDSAAPAGEKAANMLSGEGKHLLLVDDDTIVSQVVARILTRANYKVTSHSNAKSALEAFRAQPESFDAVITDFYMPGMNGVELSREISSLRPKIPIVLVTGYAGSCSPEDIASSGVCKVVGKPFDPAGFSRILREIMTATPG